MTPRDADSFRGSPIEWLAYAESDLKMARLAFQAEPLLGRQAGFHTQQTVEKALKAVMIACDIDTPLTHDIGLIIRILREHNNEIPDTIANADCLTPYAVENRYPGLDGEPDHEQVEAALHAAKTVLNWARDFIAKKGYEDK